MGSGAAPTLSAVAREAGVSPMTASRVLRNSGPASAQAKARVLAAVEKLGYRPNPLVTAFMTYIRGGRARDTAGTLAYLTSGTPRHEWLSQAAFRCFHLGAAERARQLGFRLEEFRLGHPYIRPARLSGILAARGICGVIVAPMAAPRGHLNLDWAKFSAVTIGYTLLRPSLPRASNDQYDSMLIALRNLHRLGYRRIALALPFKDDERVHYRWSAAFASFHARRGAKGVPLVHAPKAWAEAEALKWVRKERPDAVVSTNAPLLKAMRKAGLRVPEEIGFADLDATAADRAGVDQRPEEVGGAAVDMVAEQMNHSAFGLPPRPRKVLVPGAWRDGPTVRDLRRKG